MGFRVRPATTLTVIVAIAFTFQLLAILSVPVTKTIHLSQYQGYTFGVFGLCYNTGTCSGIQIGYSARDIEDLQGFSLPSNARHSVSKLLIVHPIATGFTLVLLCGSIVLHWHGPTNSLKFLFFLLLWTIPTFLLCLLSFLVDILLFIPHLDWGGWIVLASSVLIALSAVLLCIVRRTVSSRKNMKQIGRTNTFDNDGYQLRPLNYAVGTVDDLKTGSEDDDESQPFVHDNTYNNTSYFNDSIQRNQTNEDLNNFVQTQPYNTMRDSPNSHYDTSNILAPLTASYRGYEDSNTNNTPNVYGYNTNRDTFTPDQPIGDLLPPPVQSSPQSIPNSTPYPTNIDTNLEISNTPYPTNEPYPLESPTSTLKPVGPRPMPANASDITTINPYIDDSFNLEDKSGEFEFENKDQTAVTREPTFRTKIAQTLNELQPEGMYSSSSFSKTDENLLGDDKRRSTLREVTEFNSEDEDEEEYEDSQQGQPFDVSSSVYSSRLPSANPTPVERSFPINQIPLHTPQRSYHQFSSIPEGVAVDRNSRTDYHDEYSFSDPNEKRATPAPSFTNASLLSSNFTSVSQREINPRYLEKNNPEEYEKYIQSQARSNTNILLESNPDFSLPSSRRRKK